MRDALREGLKKWKALPEVETKAGALRVPEHGPVDGTYYRVPPQNSLILNVYTRALDHVTDNQFADAVCKIGAGDEAARDHLWLTEPEWKSLIPPNPKISQKFPMPEKIAERILRFHFVDNTRGEPPFWRKNDIRSRDLNLIVEEVKQSSVRLRIQGTSLLSTQEDATKSERGFDASLLGYIEYDSTKTAITRFSVVAVGDHWGTGAHTQRGTRL
ncbi:MAG TPA: hypothetical protein VK615_05540, partial [Candidatus Binatia bacterium]|nr:hypothetical protein [Candidatus Binatia bacterium]